MQVLRNVGMLRLRDGSVTVNFEDHGDYVPVPLLLETSAGLPAAADDKQIVSEEFKEGEKLVFRGLAHYGALATVLQRSTDVDPGVPPPLGVQSSAHSTALTADSCCCVTSKDRTGTLRMESAIVVVWAPALRFLLPSVCKRDRCVCVCVCSEVSHPREGPQHQLQGVHVQDAPRRDEGRQR